MRRSLRLLVLSLAVPCLARAADCEPILDESSPHPTYLIHYQTAVPRRPADTREIFEKFDREDLQPFLRRQFPAAAERITYFARPDENFVTISFPDDRVPIVASVKSFERWPLKSVRKVTVEPGEAALAEPNRFGDEDSPPSRDFMISYPSSLDEGTPDVEFENLSRDFVARDLVPWLNERFPGLASRVEITPFPQLSSVNLRFPARSVPSIGDVRDLESRRLTTVSGVEVFNER